MRIIMTILVDIDQEKYAIEARPNHVSPEDVYFDILGSVNQDLDGVGGVINSSLIDISKEGVKG